MQFVCEMAWVSRNLEYQSRGRGFESYSGHFHSHKWSGLSSYWLTNHPTSDWPSNWLISDCNEDRKNIANICSLGIHNIRSCEEMPKFGRVFKLVCRWAEWDGRIYLPRKNQEGRFAGGNGTKNGSAVRPSGLVWGSERGELRTGVCLFINGGNGIGLLGTGI